MTSIYTTKDILEAICLEEQKKAWLDIIIKLKEVYVNETDIFKEDVDPGDDPFYILDQMEVDIRSDEKDFINSINTNPISVLQHPNGIYLLDIPINKADAIQKDYGVICQSSSKMDCSILIQPHLPSELDEGDTHYSWNKFVGRYVAIPSNSILVIDAHLFDNDRFDERLGCYDNKHRDGINNLFELLDSILPKHFDETYHIGVLITDIDIAKANRKSRSNLTNNRIASAINKLKKSLNRNYNINTEVVFFDSRDIDGHKLIHNRRVISNYFIITADYKLATLRDGRCLCSQTVAAFPLFENIVNDPDSDKKEKKIRNELRKFQYYLRRQADAIEPTATLYQNGKAEVDLSTMLHRLLKN